MMGSDLNMKRTIAIISMIALMTLGLAACGGSGAPASTPSSKTAYAGFGYEDTGAGEMTLVTAGGNSKNNNIPQVASSKTMSVMQIKLEYEGGDGTLCTLYIDGNEERKLNASEKMSGSLSLQGPSLDQGIHTVEMLAKDGDNVKLYKKAQYEIVW